MSIVKNLQTLQTGTIDHESDELKQLEEQRHHHQEPIGPIGVKRKSLDKVEADLVSANVVVDYLNRIPPPAHHNVIVNQQQQQQQPQQQQQQLHQQVPLHHHQQQQNGYIEFERWNLALPHAKLITTGPGTFIAQQPQQQQTLHHGANIVANTVVHQQQPLIISQHAPATVSYFPTFHIAPSGHQILPLQHQQQQQQLHPLHNNHQHHHHHQQHLSSHDMHSTMDMTSLGMVDANICQHNNICMQNSIKDDKPQVIVPNIEEELGFLQQAQHHNAVLNNHHHVTQVESKRTMNNDPNTGFMTSYLKFLQGEKDSSPPPVLRGGINKPIKWFACLQ
jgi:hypothetical protein